MVRYDQRKANLLISIMLDVRQDCMMLKGKVMDEIGAKENLPNYSLFYRQTRMQFRFVRNI
jgi:hypothetical protein